MNERMVISLSLPRSLVEHLREQAKAKRLSLSKYVEVALIGTEDKTLRRLKLKIDLLIAILHDLVRCNQTAIPDPPPDIETMDDDEVEVSID